MAENLRHLSEWWSSQAQRQTLRSDQFGVMPHAKDGWVEGSKGRFLFRLGCLGMSLLRQRAHGDVAFAVLDGAGFYARLYDTPGSVEQLLDELFEQGLGARADLFEDLHLVLMLARSLRGAEAWCESLDEMPADALLSALWQRLAAFQLQEEVLWIAREMSLFGLWRQEGLAALRVVPTLEVRRMAFHLGFVDSARAQTLPNLVSLSKRLTPLLGVQLEAPLLGLWRAYGARPPQRFWSR
jgi:AcrR family transcriptional regulator